VVCVSVIVVQRKDIKMNKMVIDGFKCVECEDTYYAMPSFGYCDNTLACATAHGDSIVAWTWVATDFDLAYLAK
jgi:hypothetical protein